MTSIRVGSDARSDLAFTLRLFRVICGGGRLRNARVAASDAATDCTEETLSMVTAAVIPASGQAWPAKTVHRSLLMKRSSAVSTMFIAEMKVRGQVVFADLEFVNRSPTFQLLARHTASGWFPVPPWELLLTLARTSAPRSL